MGKNNVDDIRLDSYVGQVSALSEAVQRLGQIRKLPPYVANSLKSALIAANRGKETPDVDDGKRVTTGTLFSKISNERFIKLDPKESLSTIEGNKSFLNRMK